MSTPQLILAILATITVAVAVLVWFVGFMRLIVCGQDNETSSWHMTVSHDDANGIAYNCWAMAIEMFDNSGAQLVREWGSHEEVGDRTNREYRLKGTTVLLELDRWNGFTISGDRELLKPVADQIETIRKPDYYDFDATGGTGSASV